MLNDIENVIVERFQSVRMEGDDIALWKSGEDKFKKKFISKNTWDIVRASYPTKDWYKGVWFSKVTPKYFLFTWLAILDRSSTRDRIKQWGEGKRHDCVFCRLEELRNHLLFLCTYTTGI